ncbi:MAG: hypothetical protein GY754_21625 [bacterium]|nr:hypothetical protein [bacterium]
MIPINIVIEDDLSKIVLTTIIKQIRKDLIVDRCFPDLGRKKASRGFGYIKKQINGFNQAAKYKPFIVITDLDKNECAPSLRKEWLPFEQDNNLLFRVAIREIESWVLADRKSFSKFLGIQIDLIPIDVDSIIDPKVFLINLARRSRKKDIKDSIVPRKKSTAQIGPDYNTCLSTFVRENWNIEQGVLHSDSLNRAYLEIENFSPKIAN